MPLRIGEHAEGHAGHLLRGLNDSAAEFLRARERRLDVIDADEEEDGILAALERTGFRQIRSRTIMAPQLLIEA